MSTRHEEGRAASADGTQLYWQAWLPQAPRASLVVVHGLAEHSGRYRHVGMRYAARGFAVYALDYRGHGRSPGPRVHVPSFSLFVDDLDAVRALAGARHEGLPRFLLGHSQGGLVALGSVMRSAAGLRGLVLTSPFLGVHPARRPALPLALAARALAWAGAPLRLPSGLDPHNVSRDPAVVRAYRDDPLVSHRVSGPWYVSSLRAAAAAHAAAPSHTLPTLLMIAGDDRLVDAEASVRWAAATPPGVVELVRWDGLFHEILNEPEQEQVLARLDEWLERRLA